MLCPYDLDDTKGEKLQVLIIVVFDVFEMKSLSRISESGHLTSDKVTCKRKMKVGNTNKPKEQNVQHVCIVTRVLRTQH